jgi:hypothetical protein
MGLRWIMQLMQGVSLDLSGGVPSPVTAVYFSDEYTLSYHKRRKPCLRDQRVLFLALALSFDADYHGLYCPIVRLQK